MIAISRPWITSETEDLVLEVLRSGHLARGPVVAELERRVADITGCRHAVAVSSGTAALEVALSLVLEPGDVVVTSPFTFAATVNAILRAGARVRFADIGDDFLIDPDAVARCAGPSVRAVLPVHLFGRPASMPAIVEVASRMGAVVVEDAAQAIGAEIGGRPVGSWGIGCFSFYATKNVTTGEGGMITTDDDDLAARARVAVDQGMGGPYEYVVTGSNHRMSDLHAAVGLPQLDRLAAITARRRANAARLTALLDGLPGIVLPADTPDRLHVFHQYTIRVTGECPVSRDALRERLAARGIQAAVYYPRALVDYPVYRDHPRVDLSPVPNARRAAGEVLSLPVHPLLGDSEIDEVAGAVREAVHA